VVFALTQRASEPGQWRERCYCSSTVAAACSPSLQACHGCILCQGWAGGAVFALAASGLVLGQGSVNGVSGGTWLSTAVCGCVCMYLQDPILHQGDCCVQVRCQGLLPNQGSPNRSCLLSHEVCIQPIHPSNMCGAARTAIFKHVQLRTQTFWREDPLLQINK
jgi:hypothetical protein